MPSEVWKSIEGYEGLYEVSNLGRVKSLRGKEKIMRSRRINRGYEAIILSKEGCSKKFLVHRLVAVAFCQKMQGCNVVNHIDNDPLNNRASNLEWVTQKGNVHHAASIGVMTIRPVIRTNGATEVCYPSVRAVSKDGFNAASVCECCQGKQQTHKGYKWRYADL